MAYRKLKYWGWGYEDIGLDADQTKALLETFAEGFGINPTNDGAFPALDEIDDRRFSEFALATEKSLVHSWSEQLQIGAVNPFAPCGFDDVAAYTEIGEANDLILITTSGSCSTEGFADWEIIVLDPGGS